MKFSPGSTPPVQINLLVIFSAFFPNFNYVEALRYVSMVIEFFQRNVIFDHSNIPGLSLISIKFMLKCMTFQSKRLINFGVILEQIMSLPSRINLGVSYLMVK